MACQGLSFSFSQSFNKHLLNTYRVSGTILGTEDTVVYKPDKGPAFTRLIF